jgi:hypothetical protein
MAGNPLAKYFPWIKQNAVMLFIGTGVFLFIQRQRNVSNTYRMVYSKFDFQRRYHLDKLSEHIEQINH